MCSGLLIIPPSLLQNYIRVSCTINKLTMETIQYIFIIFGLCFTVLSSGTIGDILGDKFEVLKINYADIVQPITSYMVNAKSILDCSRQCLYSETCLSVLYYRDKNICNFNTQQVQFQSDAVIPSPSSFDVLVPIVAVGTERL